MFHRDQSIFGSFSVLVTNSDSFSYWENYNEHNDMRVSTLFMIQAVNTETSMMDIVVCIS